MENGSVETGGKIVAFWAWFAHYQNLLFKTPLPQVVDLVTARLHEVDFGLSVEAEESTSGKRCIYITSHGNVELFDLITSIDESSPRLINWSVFPFKPPRQPHPMEFDGLYLNIERWRFVPLINRTQLPQQFGIKFKVNTRDAIDLTDQSIRSITENIIGEILLSACKVLKISSDTEERSMPVSQLSESVYAWAATRGDPTTQRYLSFVEQYLSD